MVGTAEAPGRILSQLASRLRATVPEGTPAVGIGLIILGITAYAFLVISARALGPERYAALSATWALVFLVGPGFFLPLEQEVGRALSARAARGVGAAPLVRRAALAGGVLVVVLTALTVVISPALLEHLFDDQVLLVVALAGAFFAYFAEHLVRGILAGAKLFNRYGLVLGVEGVCRLGACVVLALVGVKTAGPYGLAIALAPIAAAAAAARPARAALLPGPEAEWGELSRALGYLLAGSLLAQLLVNAGPLAVKILAGPGEESLTGHFLAGLVITRVPLFLFQAVQAAILPRLSGLAAAGRHADFRTGLGRLLLVVAVIGGLAIVGALIAGPLAVRVLFGSEFKLSRLDLTYLAAGSAAYMLSLALAQALIALSAYARVAAAWAVGVVVFFIVTFAVSGLLFRVELGFLAGAGAASVAMGAGLLPLLGRMATTPAERLVDATHEVPVEP